MVITKFYIFLIHIQKRGILSLQSSKSKFCLYKQNPLIHTKIQMNLISTLNLTTRTPIERQQLIKLRSIWQTLYDLNDAVHFRVPVDWQGYGLTDYPDLIKNPMDLGTVEKKLSDGEYLYVEDMLDHLQLIWDNCKTYNLAGSWIYVIAEKLEKNFKRNLKNSFPEIPFSLGGIKLPPEPKKKESKKGGNRKNQQEIFDEDDSEEKISYEEKLAFSHKMENLSAQDLGSVVEKIVKSCPTAFSELQNDRVQIQLENIDLIAFQEISAYFCCNLGEQRLESIKRVKPN